MSIEHTSERTRKVLSLKICRLTEKINYLFQDEEQVHVINFIKKQMVYRHKKFCRKTLIEIGKGLQKVLLVNIESQVGGDEGAGLGDKLKGVECGLYRYNLVMRWKRYPQKIKKTVFKKTPTKKIPFLYENIFFIRFF